MRTYLLFPRIVASLLPIHRKREIMVFELIRSWYLHMKTNMREENSFLKTNIDFERIAEQNLIHFITRTVACLIKRMFNSFLHLLLPFPLYYFFIPRFFRQKKLPKLRRERAIWWRVSFIVPSLSVFLYHYILRRTTTFSSMSLSKHIPFYWQPFIYVSNTEIFTNAETILPLRLSSTFSERPQIRTRPIGRIWFFPQFIGTLDFFQATISFLSLSLVGLVDDCSPFPGQFEYAQFVVGGTLAAVRAGLKQWWVEKKK